jgi:S1-C subfamily serine protease
VTIRETIEWQVYDPLNKRVIYKATTQGGGKATGLYADSQLQAMYGAFDEAARSLVALPEFRQAATRSPGEENALAELSQETSPSTTIPNVALSTRPFQERVKECQSQVVTVRSASGIGSGYYIADGLLLTNHHVAAKGTTVKIRFASGKEIAGLTIASNARRDVALIRTENVDLPGLPLRLQPPSVGNTVYVIGSPVLQELEGTVSAGIVSAIREYEHKNWIQSDAAVTHGNSGGPMFDDRGNVIGMTDIGITPEGVSIGLNLFIPVAEALDSVGVVLQPPTAEKLISKVSTKKKPAP